MDMKAKPFAHLTQPSANAPVGSWQAYLAERDKTILAATTAFNPNPSYPYPHMLDSWGWGEPNNNPTSFSGKPFSAKDHGEIMDYRQNAAFTQWHYEDHPDVPERPIPDDRHCLIALWMRRLMEVSGSYKATLSRLNPDRSTTTYQARIWEYNLATMWAASMLAPLIADWGFTFRYEADNKGVSRDLENECLMLDFAIGPNRVLSTPAYYVARSVVQHAQRTGEFGSMVAAMLDYKHPTSKDKDLPYYTTIIRQLEAHGHHDYARRFYFHLRPDIRNSAYDEVVVPFKNAEHWVHHNDAVAAYESEYDQPAPIVTTVGDMRHLARNEGRGGTQWYWYCCWRYGYALDWKSLMWITDNLPESHPLLGIRRWMAQFT